MDKINVVVGLELTDDIYSSRGILLLKKGTVMNEHQVELLNRHDILHLTNEQAKETSGVNLEFELYEEVLSDIKNQYKNIIDKQSLSNEDVEKMTETYSRVFSEIEVNIIDLKEKLQQDEYLFEHSFNVGMVARRIGKDLGLSKDDQLLLAQMGLFHDIGKFKIDPRILNKPSRLTDAEFNEIKKHTIYGYDLIKNTNVADPIKQGTIMHHERMDGGGYPFGVKEEKIPFFVRILSIADSFDAICSNRVYKGTQSIFFAIEELLKDAEENRLDKKITKIFTYNLMRDLIGKTVPLRNDIFATISEVDPENPNQPVLEIEGYPPLDLKVEKLTLMQVAKI